MKQILSKIDDLLNVITMYRLMLYVLIALVVIASLFGLLGLVPYSFISIILTASLITIICWVTNKVFAKVFKVPTNIESVYITALILALIVSPIQNSTDLVFVGWVSVLAMASKYILAVNKKHIFNPAAVAVVITSFAISRSASWWVGNAAMSPFIIIGGFLIVRKIKRADMVIAFLVSAIISILLLAVVGGNDIVLAINNLILHSSLLFLAFFMLTEPLTTPPKKSMQIVYGILTGVLFIPQLHIGSLYSTPELALIAGNIFSYFVSPKQKLILKLKEKTFIAPDILEFVFSSDQNLKFKSGQYMELTMDYKKPDSRGNRRYFTLASSPTENEIRFGVKFYENGSGFKKALSQLKLGDAISASQLAGEFTLPEDSKQKLVFMAGGIGVTPYRSMIKYLLDKKEPRSITLVYTDKTPKELVYRNIFDTAAKELGIKNVYAITDTASVPQGWNGLVGRVDDSVIRTEIPDFKERLFYLSGSHAVVTAFENLLQSLGVPGNQIKKDFFPGFV